VKKRLGARATTELVAYRSEARAPCPGSGFTAMLHLQPHELPSRPSRYQRKPLPASTALPADPSTCLAARGHRFPCGSPSALCSIWHCLSHIRVARGRSRLPRQKLSCTQHADRSLAREHHNRLRIRPPRHIHRPSAYRLPQRLAPSLTLLRILTNHYASQAGCREELSRVIERDPSNCRAHVKRLQELETSEVPDMDRGLGMCGRREPGTVFGER